MTINATEIKPGDLIDEYGLIINVDHEGTDKFWGGKANVTFICLHDAYHGTCCASLKYKDYELIEGEERKEWLLQARKEVISHAEDLQKDLQLIESTIMKDKKNGTND